MTATRRSTKKERKVHETKVTTITTSKVKCEQSHGRSIHWR